MSLRAAAHHILVTPTGDDSQTETSSGLIAVHKPEGRTRPVYRGVVEHVGPHSPDAGEGLGAGCVAHYTQYYELGSFHVVMNGDLLAWEPIGE